MRTVPGRMQPHRPMHKRCRQQRCGVALKATVTRQHALAAWWMLACVVILSALPVLADDADNVQLKMSTTLTFDAEGSAPTASVPLSGTVIATDPSPARTRPVGLAVLCIALGALVGTWFAWRRPVDLTPAQDRLADELARSRARYLGLLEQRDQRRDEAWDTTVTTLRDDLARTRKLLDEQRDKAAELDTALHEQQDQDTATARDRDALAATLSEVRDELAQTRTTLTDERARHRDVTSALRDAQTRIETLDAELATVTLQAAKAEELRGHATRLEHRLDAATAELDQSRQKTGPLTEEARAAQESVARMLDKNLALEAELARLAERQAISEHGQAQQVAELLDQVRTAEQRREQLKTDLDHKLASATSDHLKRENNLSEKLHDAAKQIEQSEQAKRRVLALLRQEKADASDALSELESLRVDHAHTLEQFETIQNMLSTAEDRIDAQDTRLHELIEENAALGQDVAEKEDALRAMAAQSTATDLSDHEAVSSSGIEVTEGPDAEMVAQTIQQLTRSRDAALEEIMHLRASQSQTEQHSLPADSADDPDSLQAARLTIRRLEADLRLRSDLVDSLRADRLEATEAQQAMNEKDEQLALLANELSLALDETSRLRAIVQATPRTTPGDVNRLQERIDGLVQRLDAKDREIAILRAAAMENQEDSTLRDHVSRLEADQDASVTVIRFLEGEVKKLSQELRGSADTARSKVG